MSKGGGGQCRKSKVHNSKCRLLWDKGGSKFSQIQMTCKYLTDFSNINGAPPLCIGMWTISENHWPPSHSALVWGQFSRNSHFWYGWTGRAFISKGSQNFRTLDDNVELFKHFIYRSLTTGFLSIYPQKNSLKIIFEMGEQVEPLSLKVLRISGYLMIWSSYLNILFTVL